MPGFWSGLAHVGARAAIGAGAGEEDAQRKMLALAAARRQQQREDEELNLKKISAVREAADAGLVVTPTAGERSGDQPPTTNPVGPSITQEAGPAATKAKPTRVGTVAGMDIAVPDHLESKAVRDRKALVDAGLAEKPELSLHQRIIELRGQGMKPEDAIRQARQEFGQEDPAEAHRRNRDYDVAHPTRRSGEGGGTPESRARYVLRRAAQLTQSKKVGYRVQPGLDRAAAEQQAGEEYDRVHGIDTGVATPSAQPTTGHASKPAPAPSAAATPQAGGDGLSDADRKMAAVDPAFKAWLIRKGKLKGP